jgi:hypothetical protein
VAAFLDGPHLGRLAVFDDHAREVWRRDLAGPSLYTSTSVVQRVNSLLAEDVRPEPGTEIVTASSLLKRSDAEAGGASEEEGQASIFSEDGTLLGELWHPGPIEGVVSLGGQNPRLLVFWGRNAEVWKTMGGSQSNVSYQAIFCVRADQLAGQAPPHHAPGVPRAKLLWYKVIKQGVAFSHVKRIPLGPDGETLEVRTNKSDTLFLNDQGKVVCDQTSSGEFRKNPPSCLRSVGVESGAEE